MIPISVCIITKNEEKNIEKCLAPLVPYNFEIIVVDTGSTDRTKEIALKYTDKVYDFEWIDDFSAARNFSLKKASHNYVLVIDSDEFLLDIDIEAMYQAINEHPKGVGCILRRSYYDNHGKQTFLDDRVERLFHKRYFNYKCRIHEQVADINTGSTYYDRYDIPLFFDHVGYCDNSGDAMEKKAKRNNDLLFKEIEENPDDPYLYFQVGQSFNLISDYDNAVIYYAKAFDLPLLTEELWVQVMACAYINALVHTGHAHEACMFFETCYDDFATDANFYCNLGNAYMNDNQPLKAMMEFIKATQCATSREEGANSYIPYYNIGVINELAGNIDAAVGFYQRCGDYPLAVERLTTLTQG